MPTEFDQCTESSLKDTHWRSFTEIHETLTMYNECLLADFPADLCSWFGVFSPNFCLFLQVWNILQNAPVQYHKYWRFCTWMHGMNVDEGYDGYAMSTFVLHRCCISCFVRVLASWTGIRDGQQELGSIRMPLKFKEFALQRGEEEWDWVGQIYTGKIGVTGVLESSRQG